MPQVNRVDAIERARIHAPFLRDSMEARPDIVETFLAAEFSQAERHLRRLAKVASLEEDEWP